tara:strand:- start:495 stop:1562 length:1068 start_codon:yes stop_codon:yes gene_type:complete
MKTIDVNLKNNAHTIYLGENISNDFSNIINTNNYDKIFIFTQQSILDLYNKHPLFNMEYENIIIEESENAKNLKKINEVLNVLAEKKCSRNSLIVGCGGGVTTDIAGFVASIYMRGIDHVLIPTSLLCMVDAAIGGKTGVNTNEAKNMIGTFKQPVAIIVDPHFLYSLDKKHIVNGFAEIVKYGLIFDSKMYHTVKARFNRMINLKNIQDFEPIIHQCCIHKKNIIVKDEFDYNQRMKLNFGHTIGHALESYYQYQNILHGDAVYYGMIAASYISWKLEYLSKDDYNDIYNFINSVSKKALDSIDIKKLKYHLMYDKKRLGNKTNFILLNNIGSAIIQDNIPESIIDESLKLLIN